VIPYSNSFIGYIYALLLLPAIILGLKEKPIKRYGLVATLIGLLKRLLIIWLTLGGGSL
jgi:membrane protein involved in D-alanine export